ncbi:saccharopine dehydrogenase family protein [Allorhizocola rhizosphaerae]|uniref:saccharopine dehydrogenase family protein n=1 Tax=Allorhizocola rhizosphaerae TaxID=1872709 RepID=UPI000E3DEA2C|nr:saccharopine dehydrogenase NADP-binding domain-containing protein [Allorhizocola rhizosphaerae]
MSILVYGANGYTGELIAREAAARGLPAVLAGRSHDPIVRLASELDLPSRVFPVDDADLDGVSVVLHCAGPFSATSGPLVEACLAAGVHYLDITGEIDVFEAVHGLHESFVERGIVACPGVGFDVIPTDCVAAVLKRELPDATHLALGFDSRMKMSPGTTKTSLESLGVGGRVRRDGKLVVVPLGSSRRTVDFGAGAKPASTIPWGDVATAYFTTGIPNIEVYVPAPPARARSLRWANLLRPILRRTVLQQVLQRRAASVAGPDAASRSRTPVWVWGEARNASGDVKTARIKVANGYDLTVTGSLAVAQHLLSSSELAGGYYTPSQLMGHDFVTRLPGSGPLELS